MTTRQISKHILSAVVVCLFILMAIGSGDAENEKNEDGTPKTERQKLLEKQFSAWDGSHHNLEKLIKKAMNDPGSYEHVETVYWDMKDHVVVRTVYTGKNAFGGRVKQFVKARFKDNGDLIEVMEEGPGN